MLKKETKGNFPESKVKERERSERGNDVEMCEEDLTGDARSGDV